MCFFIALSCTLVFTFLFAEETGYDVFGVSADTGETVLVYHHNNADGEDLLFEEYSKEYESLKKSKTVELSKGYTNLAYLISGLISFVFVVGTTYVPVWEIGNKDINRVNMGMKKENKLTGLFAGLIASIPSLAVYATLWLSHLKVLSTEFLSVFRFFNSHFYGFISFVYGNATNTAELSVTKLLLLSVTVWLLPLVTAVGYYVGYKDIRISEKMIYIKKK